MMSLPTKIYIAGTGMITPLGGDSAATLAAVNAGVSAYRESSFYSRNGTPITLATVPGDALPPLHEALQDALLSSREKRLIRLAAPALKEVLANYPVTQPLPLFLAGPESLFESVNSVTTHLIKHIKTQTDANIDLSNSRFFALGRVGVIEAIAVAFRYFSVTNTPYVLVGGVDSFVDAATLGYLDSDDRVLAENKHDAFAPGEGAGFLLLLRDQPGRNGKDLPAIFPPGLGIEEGHRYSVAPYLGAGLATAFGGAIAGGDKKKIAAIFSSMNGENFFAKEFGVAILRNTSAFTDDFSHHHPADCFGDLGAAAAPILIAMAYHKILKSERNAQALVCCSSDLAARAAVCIS